MTNVPPFQHLVDAAFAHALDANRRARFFKHIVPDFRRWSGGNDFADALVSRPASDKSNGVGPRRQMRVREGSDARGLEFVWRVGAGTERVVVSWRDLNNLPCPESAKFVAVAFARQMARTIWSKAIGEFEDELRSGRVSLMGRIDRPFEDQVPIPEAVMAHLEITDWRLGTGHAAGTPVFDLVVVPELDEEADYRAKIRAAGRVWTKLLPVIIARLFPTGTPNRNLLSDQDFGNALEGELRRLKIAPPKSERTYGRARDGAERTKTDK